MTALTTQPRSAVGIVLAAARWLASQKRPPVAVPSALQERFGLTSEEADQAIKEARLIHARAY
jgi:hypothetical protein